MIRIKQLKSMLTDPCGFGSAILLATHWLDPTQKPDPNPIFWFTDTRCQKRRIQYGTKINLSLYSKQRNVGKSDSFNLYS
jgi:hypothetical protein